MEANDIIKAVGLTYAKMETYQDVGSIKISKGDRENPESILNFKTYFIRPQSFRFESTQANGTNEARYILWSDGKKVARQSNGYTQQLSENALFRNPLKDMERALSSLPVAKPIVSLLIEKLKGARLTELPDFKLIGEEICSGTPCGRLQSCKGSECTDIWVSKANYTIIKLVEKSTVAGNEETIKVNSQPKFSKKVPLVYDYDFENIWVNEPIPAALFQIS
jgi:outer membrane lipoprotein-sorting protein